MLVNGMVMHLDAVTADGFIAGPGEETRHHVQGGGHQEAVDFVCVTCEHGLTVPVLGEKNQNVD